MDRANRLPVIAVAVARVVVARIEMQYSGEVSDVAVRVRDGRPIDAAPTGTERSPPAEPGAGEEDAVGSVSTPSANNVPVYAEHRRPCPVAFVVEIG